MEKEGMLWEEWRKKEAFTELATTSMEEGCPTFPSTSYFLAFLHYRSFFLNEKNK